MRDRGQIYRSGAQRRARQLEAEMKPDGAKGGNETYPKLANSGKLLEFQSEIEAHENRFNVRLGECAGAGKPAS